ncbi:aldehyde ferredoxin oxidoreductase C-terminal domain-containing protein, partial [Chloroflexota bacterium]
FAINVKGVDLPEVEPRLQAGLALGYMVDPHGADHIVNFHDHVYMSDATMDEVRPEGFIQTFEPEEMNPQKTALFKAEHVKAVIPNCLVVCSMPFIPMTNVQIAEITAAVTGWDTGLMELMRIGERVLTMDRLFNVRNGLTAEDDRLPQRFFQPKTDGPVTKGLDPEKMEKAKKYYYTLMGWDAETGIPLPEKLEDLGIQL